MRAIRGVAVVGLAVALLGLVVIVTVPQETSADTNTWTTDSDWLSGTMPISGNDRISSTSSIDSISPRVARTGS